MTFGPNYFYKCPSCSKILKNRSLMSGNTFGARSFSDGRRIAPMLPDIPSLTKCPECNTILWLSDLEKIGTSRQRTSEHEPPGHPAEWDFAQYVEHLELDDLWRALDTIRTQEDSEQENPEKKRREIFIRQRIWWKYNRKGFETADEIDVWLENCYALLNLLDRDKPEQCCMAAELNRNLCNFSKCVELVEKLPEEYNTFKVRMLEECKDKNPLTVELNREKEIDDEAEKIFPENKPKSDISNRLAEKVGQDENLAKNTLEFYQAMAENNNIEAQFELGELYNRSDLKLYDPSKAAHWYYYAAVQGHKAAIFELEDLQFDDGRYDAWV